MWQTLLDFVFPRRSLTGEPGVFVTEGELRAFASHPVTEGTGLLRSRELSAIDSISAASTYRDCPLLRRAVHIFKYRRIPALQHALGALLAGAPFVQVPPQGAVLCPVPLHWTRQFYRGFNQAALLADVVANECGLRVEHLLKRTRATGHQARRSRSERLAALHRAFRCRKPTVPYHIILVDDLATTGATLDACAAALKECGAQRVDAWCIAHDGLTSQADIR